MALTLCIRNMAPLPQMGVHTKSTCGPVFMMCLHLTVHTPSSNNSQVILKPEVE
jgi:hypothetical protein